MLKKLLCLNLAIIILLSLVTVPVVATEPTQAGNGAERVSASNEEPAQYIKINGTKYDATQEQSGPGWELFYYGNYGSTQPPSLYLTNYNGGPIESNGDLNIYFYGTNTVTGEDGCGIYVNGRLSISSGYHYLYGISHINVVGAEGYPAICAEGAGSRIGGMYTLSGGGVPAVFGTDVSLEINWPAKVCYGESAENITEKNVFSYWNSAELINENYIHTERIPYTLTLHGNGGITEEGMETYSVVMTSGTPGYLFLYPHKDVFSNGDKRLLGWSETENYNEDTFHPINEEYNFSKGSVDAELYAIWENETMKEIVLNNYYWQESVGHYYGEPLIIVAMVGETISLPASEKPGAKMLGWRGENGKLYPVGTQIKIVDSISFTAEYEPLYIEIDGERYPADSSQGSHAQGWSYFPSTAQLDIYENYSGGYIKIPFDVNINLLFDNKSITGGAGKPVIEVDGDVSISCMDAYGDNGIECRGDIELIGGDGNPAIKITGQLSLYGYFADGAKLHIIGGGRNVPAISAGEGVSYDGYSNCFYTGSSKETLEFASGYSGEHVFAIGDTSITLTGQAVLPEPPQRDGYTFYAWGEESDLPYWDSKLFLPGDIVDAGEGTSFTPRYVSNNGTTTALVIDGQGGQTENGSTCFVYFVSSPTLIKYEDVDCEFTLGRKALLGFNSSPSGNGQAFEEGSELTNAKLIHKYYAIWSAEDAMPLSGTALSWNNTDDAVYVLYEPTVIDEAILAEWKEENYSGIKCTDKESPVSVTVDGKQMYSQTFRFHKIANGNYKLAIFKPDKYVPKIVEVTVSDSNVNLGQQKLWLYGDVNYDGKIRAGDATQVLQYIAKTRELTEEQIAAADVTRDGKIRAGDATQIKRYIAKMESSFNSMK